MVTPLALRNTNTPSPLAPTNDAPALGRALPAAVQPARARGPISGDSFALAQGPAAKTALRVAPDAGGAVGPGLRNPVVLDRSTLLRKIELVTVGSHPLGTTANAVLTGKLANARTPDQLKKLDAIASAVGELKGNLTVFEVAQGAQVYKGGKLHHPDAVLKNAFTGNIIGSHGKNIEGGIDIRDLGSQGGPVLSKQIADQLNTYTKDHVFWHSVSEGSPRRHEVIIANSHHALSDPNPTTNAASLKLDVVRLTFEEKNGALVPIGITQGKGVRITTGGALDQADAQGRSDYKYTTYVFGFRS